MSELRDRAKAAQERVTSEEIGTGDRWWDGFERDATAALARILEQDPGVADRLEPGSKHAVAVANTYPRILNARPLLVFYPDGVEVACELGSGDPRFYVVHRSDNPMEESILSEFADLASFGRALG